MRLLWVFQQEFSRANLLLAEQRGPSSDAPARSSGGEAS
jgi:hypothetical protein